MWEAIFGAFFVKDMSDRSKLHVKFKIIKLKAKQFDKINFCPRYENKLESWSSNLIIYTRAIFKFFY